MKIISSELYVKDNKVYHEGNKPKPKDIGAAPETHTHNYASATTPGGSAEHAIKATEDSLGQRIDKYIKGLSVSGRTITYTRGDGTTGTITTQDNDTKVTNTLNTTAKAYITGTTNSATNTGTQVFDTNVYLDTTAGMLTATTFKGALQGNAATATSATSASHAAKLTTPRSINGTNFDGTAAITTANWGTARTLTIGNTGKSVNGSGNVSWSIGEIGAAPTVHNHTSLTGITNLSFAAEGSDSASITTTVDGVNTYFDFNLSDDPSQNDMWRWRFRPSQGNLFNAMTLDAISTTEAKLAVTGEVQATRLKGTLTGDVKGNVTGTVSGNAGSATKLATARTINGTNFDGTGNITTANWGTARNIQIGNTAKSVNGSGNVSWTLSEIGAAAASHTHNSITNQDTRSVNTTPTQMPLGLSVHLKANGTDGLNDGGHYHSTLMIKGWNDASGGPFAQMTVTENNNLYFRSSINDTWNAWKKVSLDGHTHNYAASPSAGGSASTVYLPRTTGASVSANYLPGANRFEFKEFANDCKNTPNASWYHIFTGQGSDANYNTQLALGMTTEAVYYRNRTVGTWGGWKQLAFTDSSISGNAATATKLQTARTIGKASFNGSANITLDAIAGRATIPSSADTHKNKYSKFARIDVSGGAYRCCSGTLHFVPSEGLTFFGELRYYFRTGSAISSVSIDLRWKNLSNTSYANKVFAVKVSDGVYDLYYQPLLDWDTMTVTNVNSVGASYITLTSNQAYVASITAAATSSLSSHVSNATAANTATALTTSAGSSTQPIYFSGGKPVAGLSYFARTTQGDIGWGSANSNSPVTVSAIAYWNGAYQGTASNLTYCKHGAFGTIVTKNASDYAASSHNHTSLTGVTSIGFNTEGSDGASIRTTISGTATYLDMYLTDDANQDKFRWRFKPHSSDTSLAVERSLMELYPISANQKSARLLVDGEVVATNENGLRVVGGNYGFFIRNDGSNTYFMFTNSGDQYGSWNGLRPICINNSNGLVTFGNGLSGSLSGNATTATKLQTARTIALGGILSGSASFDGSGNVTINATANDITTITKSLNVTTSWMDTGITGSNLATGTYAVQMLVDDGTNTNQWSEHYSGIMSWFNGGTNSTDADEILLHKAGHASNGRHTYLRTIRTGNPGSLKLQISCTHAFSAASNITFKFKKLI